MNLPFTYPETWTVHDDVKTVVWETGTDGIKHPIEKVVQGPGYEVPVPRETMIEMFFCDLILLALVIAAVVGLVVALAS